MHGYTLHLNIIRHMRLQLSSCWPHIQVKVNQFASQATSLRRMLVHRSASSTGVPAFNPAMQRDEPAQRVRFHITCIMEIVNIAVYEMLMEDTASLNGPSRTVYSGLWERYRGSINFTFFFMLSST